MLDALGLGLQCLGAVTLLRWTLRGLAWGVAPLCAWEPMIYRGDRWRDLAAGAAFVAAVVMVGVLAMLAGA